MTKLSSTRPLLLPLVPLYRLALALRELSLRTGLEPVRRLRWPVLSVGNLSTGGAGKTPLVIALAQALTARGLHVDVLSRGYGRKNKSPALVDPSGTAHDFGDEPLLIARAAAVPVYVAAKRYEAGLLAESAFPADVLKGHDFSRADSGKKDRGALAPEAVFSGSLHLLDDGFQHRQLHRDADILLLNRQDLSDRLLPAGNLRELLHSALRAGVLAIPAEDPDLESELQALGWRGPLWRLHRSMEVPPIDGPVIAFCGIARPAQFFEGLVSAGLHLASRIAFPDHHRYIDHDFDCLLDAARTVSAAALLTTEKDRVRLGSLAANFPPSIPLKTARLTIEIENEKAALDWLLSRVRSGA
jgi:tetraacyldisaccharide 4'-kinase